MVVEGGAGAIEGGAGVVEGGAVAIEGGVGAVKGSDRLREGLVLLRVWPERLWVG